MAKKKAKKKTAKSASAAKKAVAPEPVAESAPALVPEQIITVRGTPVGGIRKMTKPEYDEYRKG